MGDRESEFLPDQIFVVAGAIIVSKGPTSNKDEGFGEQGSREESFAVVCARPVASAGRKYAGTGFAELD